METIPTRDSQGSCLRCQAPLAKGAHYCPLCGVSVSEAATGEYTRYDLDRFFNYALDMLCIAGIDGYFKLVNPAFERLTGLKRHEVAGRTLKEVLPGEDPVWIQRFGAVALTGEPIFALIAVQPSGLAPSSVLSLARRTSEASRPAACAAALRKTASSASVAKRSPRSPRSPRSAGRGTSAGVTRTTKVLLGSDTKRK